MNSRIILDDLDSYSEKLKISQIIIFFERKGISLTKTTIQNYVRIGILPSLSNKKYYEKIHIIYLTMIIELRQFYSLNEIKNILFFVRDFDYKELKNIYEEFLEIQETIKLGIDIFFKNIIIKIDSLNKTTENYKNFMFLLSIASSYNYLKEIHINSIFMNKNFSPKI
ncbi:MAG: DUF1836 domain-containing protein [Defluviitaleaceae bacterium]|nr:DUF1836 domain-containing protein [Defluviitaleaceae bacterium]